MWWASCHPQIHSVCEWLWWWTLGPSYYNIMRFAEITCSTKQIRFQLLKATFTLTWNNKGLRELSSSQTGHNLFSRLSLNKWGHLQFHKGQKICYLVGWAGLVGAVEISLSMNKDNVWKKYLWMSINATVLTLSQEDCFILHTFREHEVAHVCCACHQ